MIPGLYNGHNKTFWFTSYEQFYTRDNQKGFWSVPREEWRRGDLSSLLLPTVLGTDVLGRPIQQGQLYDPATTRTVAVGGQSYVVRDPFPNNQIPLRSGVAKRILSFMPQASVPGLDANNLSFHRYPPATKLLELEMITSSRPEPPFGLFNYMYTHKINATPFQRSRLGPNQTITSKIVRINHDYTFGTMRSITLPLTVAISESGRCSDRGFD